MDRLVNPEVERLKEEIAKRLTPFMKAYYGEPARTIDQWIPQSKARADEEADAIIRILDITAMLNIDMTESLKIKMRYNDTRPYRHGGKYA